MDEKCRRVNYVAQSQNCFVSRSKIDRNKVEECSPTKFDYTRSTGEG